MIEMILRLFEARAASLESICGRSSGALGRDEFVAAASAACRDHPIGWHVFMTSECGDDVSAGTLMAYLVKALPTPDVAKAAMAVLLGRPLPEQLDSLVLKSPYFDAERRRAAIVMERAKRARRAGDQHKYQNLLDERNGILAAARHRVEDELLSTGICPKCHGSGRRERKQDECPVCRGRGRIQPAVELVARHYGQAASDMLKRVVDVVLVDKSQAVQVMVSRLQMEREAVAMY